MSERSELMASDIVCYFMRRFHDATSILFFPEEKEEEMMRRVEGINWGVV